LACRGKLRVSEPSKVRKEIQFENIKEHLGKVTERLEEQSYYISQLQALAKIENLESDKMACSHSREERVKALKSEANVLKEMLDQKSRGKDPQYWSEFVQDLLFRESLAELEADKAIQTNLNSVLKKFMAVGITENKRLRNGTHFLELLKKLNESLSDWEVARKKEKEREHTRLRLDCKAAELEKQMDSIQNMLIPNRGLTFYGQSNNQVPSYRHLEYTARNTVSRLRTGNDALTERTESRRVHTLSNLGVQVDSSPLQPSRSKTNQQTELGKRLSDAEGSAMKKKLFQGQESAAKDVQESENHLLASKLKKKSRHSNQADGDYNGRAEKEGSALKQLKMF
jgi:hypothetical protein